MTRNKLRYTIRQLKTSEEYNACLQLQKKTWGEDFSECVPASILLVGQKIGGVSAGAFDEHDHLIGLVFSLAGVKDGQLVHWSDLLAVKEEYRDTGLGMQLKLFQRAHCLQIGVETIYWTYDPLEARNAHLNINKLGANIDEYVAEMYVSSDSKLHQGLAMDRFVVVWHIACERVEQALAGERIYQKEEYALAPVVNMKRQPNGETMPVASAFPISPEPEITNPKPQIPKSFPKEQGFRSLDTLVRVEIPENIQQLKENTIDRAVEWRANTRTAFQFYLKKGYTIDGFYREKESGRCFYVLILKINKR